MTIRTSPIYLQTLPFVIPLRSDTYIQSQQNSDYNASLGENHVALSGLYQITNHHDNMDVKYNDDSKSFETHRKNNCSSLYFYDTITTVELILIWFSLVASSYQLTFNPIRRSYVVYELTISTTYHYSSHNHRYFITLSP